MRNVLLARLAPGVVESPFVRSKTNRRMYSDEDIERLRLLRRVVQAGHSIGQVAGLTRDRLIRLLKDENTRIPDELPAGGLASLEADSPVSMNDLIASVDRLDAKALEKHLARADVVMSRPSLIENVIVPLMEKVGALWAEGTMRIAHEHLASAVVRQFLWNLDGTDGVEEGAPSLIAATPAGQYHEIGACIVAAIAMSAGWRVSYLGSNMPAEEIAGAARLKRSKAVALSIIYPPDDPKVIQELKKLRRALPDDVAILVGGRAAHAYREVINLIDAKSVADMHDLSAQLRVIKES